MRCGLTVRRHIGLSATRTILTYHPVRYADNNRRVMLRELYRSNEHEYSRNREHGQDIRRILWSLSVTVECAIG